MDQLWSPWRSLHIERMTSREAREEGEKSVFLQLAEQDRDEESLILWRGEGVFVIMNRYPYNNGHLLIVPFRQIASYEELTSLEQAEIAAAIGRCIGWLRRGLDPDGFNVGMNLGSAGGAGIPEHLHVHVVPRWSGDTNFMSSVADLKVIPEALEQTYRKLKTVITSDM